MPADEPRPRGAGPRPRRAAPAPAPWWLPRDPLVGVRVAGVLSMAGACYEVAAHALDPGSLAGRPAAWAVVLAGSSLLFLLALGPAFAPGRVPRWSAALLAHVAMTLVIVLGLASRDVSFDTQVAFGWVPLYAAYHLPTRGAWLVTVIATVLDAALLTTLTHPARAVQELLAFVATFGVTTWLLSGARDRAAAVVEELRDLAERDPLTGLATRRVLDRRTREACAAPPAALLLVDVDHFKSVNDDNGHATGDAVLRAVAEVLRAESRATDVPGRYGGDELAVLMPGTDRDGAVGVAERVRAAVEALRVPSPDHRGRPVAVTVSVGVGLTCTRTPPEDLLASADRSLYLAKRGGRNRVAEPA